MLILILILFLIMAVVMASKYYVTGRTEKYARHVSIFNVNSKKKDSEMIFDDYWFILTRRTISISIY